MSRKVLTVTAERSPKGWWVTECAEFGCVSQVADDIREAVAFQSGLVEDQFDICVIPVLPDAYTRALREAEEQRKLAA